MRATVVHSARAPSQVANSESDAFNSEPNSAGILTFGRILGVPPRQWAGTHWRPTTTPASGSQELRGKSVPGGASTSQFLRWDVPPDFKKVGRTYHPARACWDRDTGWDCHGAGPSESMDMICFGVIS